MRKSIQVFAIFLIFGPFSAMFAEPFFAELFDYYQIDSEKWAVPFATYLIGLFSGEYFRWFVFYSAGFGCGLWAYYLAVKFGKRKLSPSNTKPADLSSDEMDPKEWALNIEAMSISDIASAFTRINPKQFTENIKAVAIARDLVSRTKQGRIRTLREEDQHISTLKVTMEGDFEDIDYPKKRGVDFHTMLYVPNLIHYGAEKNLDTSWIQKSEFKSRYTRKRLRVTAKILSPG